MVLRNPLKTKQFLDDKETIIDIGATDRLSRQIDVEIQFRPWAAYRDRALYYWNQLDAAW